MSPRPVLDRLLRAAETDHASKFHIVLCSDGNAIAVDLNTLGWFDQWLALPRFGILGLASYSPRSGLWSARRLAPDGFVVVGRYHERDQAVNATYEAAYKD